MCSVPWRVCVRVVLSVYSVCLGVCVRGWSSQCIVCGCAREWSSLCVIADFAVNNRWSSRCVVCVRVVVSVYSVCVCASGRLGL